MLEHRDVDTMDTRKPLAATAELTEFFEITPEE